MILLVEAPRVMSSQHTPPSVSLNDLHTNALSMAWDKWNINAQPSAWYLSGIQKKKTTYTHNVYMYITTTIYIYIIYYILYYMSCMRLYLICMHVYMSCETWITYKTLTYYICSRRFDLWDTTLHPITCVQGAVTAYSNLHNHSCSLPTHNKLTHLCTHIFAFILYMSLCTHTHVYMYMFKHIILFMQHICSLSKHTII